jgi:hypothetical protein
MANVKLKTSGKVAIGLFAVAVIFGLKVLWWDNRPHEVEDSKTFGQVAIPDAPEASLSGKAAIKLNFPSPDPANNGGTKVNWYIMAWQSQNGMAYATTDEYYKRIDETMRKRFPENFEGAEEEKSSPRTKPSTVVASASRSTSSKKIKLKTSELAIAKKLGLTPEQYARELMKMEA